MSRKTDIDGPHLGSSSFTLLVVAAKVEKRQRDGEVQCAQHEILRSSTVGNPLHIDAKTHK